MLFDGIRWARHKWDIRVASREELVRYEGDRSQCPTNAPRLLYNQRDMELDFCAVETLGCHPSESFDPNQGKAAHNSQGLIWRKKNANQLPAK